MLNNGPTITIEEFELKYPKDIKTRFDNICELASSGDKAGARLLISKLSQSEAEIFRQYPSEVKVYNLLLAKRIEEIDHRLAAMKEEKKQVLSQYNQATASNMREFKPTTPTNSPAVTTTTTPKKRTSCSIM